MRSFRLLILLGIMLLGGFTHSQAQPVPESYKVGLDYYLPSEWKYTLDSKITTPEQYLGFALGSQHVDWAQVLGYMQLLTQQSKRFSMKTYGSTHEHRPLICLAITSPENQKNLEQIRQNHLLVKQGKKDNGPMVTLCGNTIHGNEPSGVQGALVVAYFLAAAQGAEVEQMLKESVILLIPGYNPDGINRFASWVNSNRCFSNTPDSNTREFKEAGPVSRYNHYWHDLNRDWLFLEQPETRFGAQVYQEWLPIVVSDHHEMSSSKTFYFSPGDANRVHEQIPSNNQDMTWEVAKYIEKGMKEIGSEYFTKRGYDDYYVGKGAAYGDVQGSICLLTEQARSRGHYVQSKNKIITFPFTIRNTSSAQFSIIYAAWKEKDKFQQYMLDFYQKIVQNNNTDEGIMFKESHSKSITWHFLNLLHMHNIKVCSVEAGLSKKQAAEGKHYFIPFKDNNPALIHTIMDVNNKNFGDSIFYDITAWTIPMAYGLKYENASSKKLRLQEVTDFTFPKGNLSGNASNGAYTFNVNEFYAPALIYALQDKGAKLRVKDGTIYAEAKEDVIRKEAERCGIDVTAADPSLDKSQFKPLRQPRIAIITVDNEHASTTGSFWYLTDYRFQMAPAVIDDSKLATMDLSKYTTLLLVDNISDAARENVMKWVEKGGVLIACNVACSTLHKMGMDVLVEKKLSTANAAAKKSGFPGGILQINKNADSPLCWGINATQVPVFKMGTTRFKNNNNTIFNFAEQPLSGYFAQAYKEDIAGTPAVITKQAGKGNLIYFNFSIAFRSYFYASTQLLSNAILFGQFCH